MSRIPVFDQTSTVIIGYVGQTYVDLQYFFKFGICFLEFQRTKIHVNYWNDFESIQILE